MSLDKKQREELIKEHGEPELRLEFDVFKGNKVSMWTHFNHKDNYEKQKEMLIKIKEHLEEFIKDGNMCPFCK